MNCEPETFVQTVQKLHQDLKCLESISTPFLMNIFRQTLLQHVAMAFGLKPNFDLSYDKPSWHQSKTLLVLPFHHNVRRWSDTEFGAL